MRRLRPRHVVALVVLVVLVVGVWCAYRALQVRSDLNAAKSDADALQSALDARDVTAADGALTSLAEHSASAADGSSGPTWRLLGHLPVVGDDVQAVGTLSDVLADLSGSGMKPLVDVARAYDDGEFSPRRGRVPVDKIAALDEPVASGQASFARADAQLSGLDGSYVGQIDDARTQLVDAVETGTKTLKKVRRAVDLLPPMLGNDGPRRYLLVLQNNAEIRSTGGFPGSTFVLTADRGRISMGEPTPGNVFGQRQTPIVDLTPAEQVLFGERAATRFVDTNTIPDFPRAAELMRLMWEDRYGGRLDGVLAADPVLLTYLLAGIPPVTAQGITLTPDNAVEELLSAPYARWTDPAQQDAFFRDVATQVFDSVTLVADPGALVDALQRGLQERRLLVSSTLRNEQRSLADAGLTGALPTGDSGPEVGVYLNDDTGRGGSKLSYYLRFEPQVRATSCRDEVQDLRAQMTLQNQAPAGGAGLAPYVTGGDPEVQLGTEGIAVLLIGPVGGKLADASVDGRPVQGKPVGYHGRPALRVELDLAAGATAQLDWRMVSGEHQVGPIRVRTTPGVVTGSGSSIVSSACD